MSERTLDSKRIDEIIAHAMAHETLKAEIEHRAKWVEILANARNLPRVKME